MSAIEIVEQIRRLPADEFQYVIDELFEAQVDARLEQRVLAGEFNAAAEKALQDSRAGRCRPLDDLINDES